MVDLFKRVQQVKHYDLSHAWEEATPNGQRCQKIAEGSEVALLSRESGNGKFYF